MEKGRNDTKKPGNEVGGGISSYSKAEVSIGNYRKRKKKKQKQHE